MSVCCMEKRASRYRDVAVINVILIYLLFTLPFIPFFVFILINLFQSFPFHSKDAFSVSPPDFNQISKRELVKDYGAYLPYPVKMVSCLKKKGFQFIRQDDNKRLIQGVFLQQDDFTLCRIQLSQERNTALLPTQKTEILSKENWFIYLLFARKKCYTKRKWAQNKFSLCPRILSLHKNSTNCCFKGEEFCIPNSK